MSRTSNLLRNAKWLYLGTALDVVLGIASRTAFSYILGTTYLGLSSFFASIVGVLSVTELGIGTVLNTQLYKPLAHGDYEKVKSILAIYRKTYHAVAIVILLAGLAIMPFVRGMIKSTDYIAKIEIYFLLYLVNSSMTYFVSYKFSLPNSEQKMYIQTNINSVFNILTVSSSILIVIVWKSYLLYLASMICINIVKLIVSNMILNKRYPIFSDRQIQKLSVDDKRELIRNIRAGTAYRLSDIAVNTSTNLILTGKVGVDTTGRFSNYSMFVMYVERFTKPLVESTGPGIGEFINTQSAESKMSLLKTYQFIGFWIYGFCSIGLVCLSTPLIHLWLGVDKIITHAAVVVYCFNFLLSGLSRSYSAIQSAHGIFYLDWYVGIVAAGINIAVSLLLVKPYGLAGVFLGSTCATLIIATWSPIITYKRFFTGSSARYFLGFAKYIIVGLFTGFLCLLISSIILTQVTFLNFVIALMFIITIPNLLWIILFNKTDEFRYVKRLVSTILLKKNY